MLFDLVYAVAEDHPDDVALVHRDERIAFGELVERVERLAAGLAARGIGPGDPVALMLPNAPEFVLAFYAITGLGAAIVPLNPQLKHDELQFRLRQSGVRAIISEDRAVGVCERVVASWEDPAEIITTSTAHGHGTTIASLIEDGEPRRLPARSPDEVFVYQFSSGSTGRPKRVARTHGNVCAEARTYPSAFGVGAGDGVFCVTPLFHDYGMTCSLLASTPTGATLVLLEDPNPFLLKRHRAIELIERERPTIFPGVPFTFRLLAEAPGEADMSSLRLCFSAGTALPREVFDAFVERFGVPVRQLYGSTETGTIAANFDSDPIGTFASVGTPIGDVRVRAVDDDGEPVAAGTVGELAVASPAMTTGYLDQPELTAAAFRDGWYLTGDLGRVDEEGRVFITGRKKLLIPVGGYKVDPIEVEDVLNAHPAVAEAIVVGVAGANAGEEIVKAAVVPSAACDERDVVRWAQERLANYKVPQIVEFRDEIPKSPTGKILRQYLL
ncbi:MAG TPA: AMP-binding protein [Conexibacter sp.]|nr:AMP-binding protein [Conexibacter sp.]